MAKGTVKGWRTERETKAFVLKDIKSQVREAYGLKSEASLDGHPVRKVAITIIVEDVKEQPHE